MTKAPEQQQETPPRAAPDAAWPPDFVDRVFDYLLSEFPHLAGPQFARAKSAVREEFAGEAVYVRTRSPGRAAEVLALFNGRNATEVARRLQISRASVYRLLKQQGRNAGPGEK